MFCRCCGLRCLRNRKINVFFGGRGVNVSKMLENRILLRVSQYSSRPLLFLTHDDVDEIDGAMRHHIFRQILGRNFRCEMLL